MSQNHFLEMAAQVQSLFPDLDDGQVQYACNKIGNELRRAEYDIYLVELSNIPFGEEPGYFAHFSVKASTKTIYVQVTPD